VIFSRGIRPEAQRDLQRVLAGSSEIEQEWLRECWTVLFGLLRYDPHLQAEHHPGLPFRVLTCGLLRVYFTLRPLDDRYVEVQGVGRNPNWVL
jgi:hypothetical protein